MNNPDFNLTGFREVKMMSAETGFALSPKQWIERTNAIGIISKSGRYCVCQIKSAAFGVEKVQHRHQHRKCLK